MTGRLLKIAYFTSYVHAQGTYFRYHNYARYIAKLGHEVTVFGCDVDQAHQSRVEDRDGVTYHIVRLDRGSRFFGNYCNPITTVRRLFEPYGKVDIAHLWQPFPGAAMSWWWRMGKLARARFYDWDDLWAGGLIPRGTLGWDQQFMRATTDRMEHALPRVADHVTTVSQLLHDLAIERGARAATIIRHGFAPYDIPDRAAARQRLGLKPDAFYVGFMGRTTNEVEWLFESIRRWRSKFPTLRLAICGANLNIVESHIRDVRDRIDNLGQLDGQGVQQFAAAIDLGLLPLKDEPFNRSRLPIKLLDHLAAGVPLLASEVGETGLIAQTMPWVIRCGITREQWLQGFGRAIALCLSGQAPKVDLVALRSKWEWTNRAAEMVSLYAASLNRGYNLSPA